MNVDQSVTEVLPFEPKTLFGAKGAVDEDGCDIAEQIRIGTPWLLTALYCPDAVQRLLLAFLNLVTDVSRSAEVCCVFLKGEDAFAVVLTRQQSNTRKHLRNLSQFVREMKNPPQRRKVAVNGRIL